MELPEIETRYEALKVVLEALRFAQETKAAQGNVATAELIQEAVNWMVLHDGW